MFVLKTDLFMIYNFVRDFIPWLTRICSLYFEQCEFDAWVLKPNYT